MGTPHANPQPSEGGPNSYLIPRSRTPEVTALYEHLLATGWRFDAGYMTWHPPNSTLFGRLEYAPDHSWATVQPPTKRADLVRERPLARFERTAAGWVQVQ